MRILVIRPGEQPKVEEIDDCLEAMQAVVGGYIESLMPWKDDVAIICNEEGKINGLPMNRGIRNDDGRLIDIIAGTFFLCYAPPESENFLSLPDNLIERYSLIFRLGGKE